MEHKFNYATRRKLTENFKAPMIRTLSMIIDRAEENSDRLKYAQAFFNFINESRNGLDFRMLSLKVEEYEKPSEFFNRLGISEFIKFFIDNEDEKKEYLDFADKTNRFQCTTGYYRRSLRTKSYAPKMTNNLELLCCYFLFKIYDCSLEDYLTDSMSEELKDLKHYSYGIFGRLPIAERIAARLDFELKNGTTKLHDAISEIIMGENNTFAVTHEMIRGICMSDDANLHELLGKFLLAARLQEGVRQAICETMDCGTVEAFKTIFNVICDNNLIRFSAVKRAVATWIGMLNENALDRVSNKTLELMKVALFDEKGRRKMCETDDAMQLLVALWAYGFYEFEDAATFIEKFALKGSRTQKLAAAYYCNFLASVPSDTFRKKQHRFAINAFIENSDDTELLAMYFNSLLLSVHRIKEGVHQYVNKINDNYDEHGKLKRYIPVTYADYQVVRPDFKEFFETQDEALLLFDSLYKFFKSLKKKEIKFEKVLFPWHVVEIYKSNVAKDICAIYYLSDLVRKNRQTELFDVIPSVEYDSYLIEAILNPNGSDAERQFVFDSVKTMKERAMPFLNQIPIEVFTEEQFIQLEKNLKYKNDDLCDEIISILKKRKNNLSISVKRMLESKEIQVRYSALSLILEAKEEIEGKVKKSIVPQTIHLKDFLTPDDFKEDILKFKDCAEEKEKVLIERIFDVQKEDELSPEAFYDSSKLTAAFYNVEFDLSMVERFGKNVDSKMINDILNKFDKLVNEHKNDQYRSMYGVDHTLGEKSDYKQFGFLSEISNDEYPFMDLWEKFYEENIKTPENVLFLKYALNFGSSNDWNKLLVDEDRLHFEIESKAFMMSRGVFGTKKIEIKEFDYFSMKGRYGRSHNSLFKDVLENIWLKKVPEEDSLKFAISVLYNIVYKIDIEKMFQKVEKERYSYYGERYESLFSRFNAINELRNDLQHSKIFALNDEVFTTYFKIVYTLHKNLFEKDLLKHISTLYCSIEEYLHAYALGIINLDDIYFALFKTLDFNNSACTLERFSFDDDDKLAWFYSCDDIKEKFLSSEWLPKVKRVSKEIYLKVCDCIVNSELKRGSDIGKFSEFATKIPCYYGSKNIVRVLKAMGKDKFIRSEYGYYSTPSRIGVFCYMFKNSKPFETDTKEDFSKIVKELKIPEQRLYEFAMYNTLWIQFISEFLGIKEFESGCYYFIAHMNEKLDEREQAIVAKYTAVSAEDLQKGAFALDWFNDLFKEIGEENFNKIYDSAKYISDGIKHARARKFADAALGRVTEDELESDINRARNKDLLMSYSLIPIDTSDFEKSRKTLVHRYEFLQKFAKESRKFGSQRRASEALALEVAYENLSRAAGYSDVNRLFLNMESALLDSLKSYFDWQKIEKADANGDEKKTVCFIKIAVDENGNPSLEIAKDLELKDKSGNIKLQKSVPASVKKDETVVEISDVQKRLKNQHERTRHMLEEFMCSSVQIPLMELRLLMDNPIVSPMLSKILFIDSEMESKNAKIGFLNDFANFDSKKELRIAHCSDLYKSGKWHYWQKFIFENQIVQPFKQIFRELYVKLDEELDKTESLMFAGNQIQPKKTAATLKSRKWIVGYYYDDGLFKVYRKENIVVEIMAVCDWFTPSDIECPTIDAVTFRNRLWKRGDETLKIKDVPDILYSEVMRDVDLAVSVAHAGSVDPETSHSTIEMRKTILEFTLPLFKVQNVRIEKNFAFVSGTRAEYQIHLGSGLVRKQAGSVINVVAVGSQQRGKIFLPFVDEDPKTAEIITKTVMFSRDSEIKDPHILEQI